MQRRQFIRVIGGGTIAAALPPLAGCAPGLPAAAVAPWQGPADTDDPRRWALAHAILAPNPHNLQSWQVDLAEPGAITLWADRERLLPETDPPGRQVLIGLGAFLELLVMALAERGRRAEVTLFPQGEPGPRCTELPARPVARIGVHAGGAGADPLFAQVRRRHTAKSDYHLGRPVPPAMVEALHDAVGAAAASFGAALDERRVQAMRALCWDAAQVELTTPRTVMESIRLTRIGPAEIERHRDGITITSPMARIVTALGLFDRSAPPEPGSSAYRQMMGRFEGHCRTAAGFVWLWTAHNRRADQVRCGRSFLRMQLESTRIGLGLHPMSQALQEFPEMAAHRERAHRLTLDRGAPSGADDPTLQMFCRIGFPTEPAGPTPRRGVDAVLRT